MRKCSACGAENEDQDKFCDRCGKVLIAAVLSPADRIPEPMMIPHSPVPPAAGPISSPTLEPLAARPSSVPGLAAEPSAAISAFRFPIMVAVAIVLAAVSLGVNWQYTTSTVTIPQTCYYGYCYGGSSTSSSSGWSLLTSGASGTAHTVVSTAAGLLIGTMVMGAVAIAVLVSATRSKGPVNGGRIGARVALPLTAVLGLAAPILVAVWFSTQPGGFWGSSSSSNSAVSTSVAYGADVGWYLALVAGLILLLGAVLHARSLRAVGTGQARPALQ